MSKNSSSDNIPFMVLPDNDSSEMHLVVEGSVQNTIKHKKSTKSIIELDLKNKQSKCCIVQ